MLPRWLITFRAFALACAFAAAFVPIATYITDDKRDWLWIHIGVNIAAYIAVALTTIYTTANLTQQDHNKFSVPAYWANNVVMRTWYLGVSKTWRWHVAAAVGRLGLALALAQQAHITVAQGFPGILSRFYYLSGVHISGTYVPELHDWMLVRSEWFTVLFGLIILFGFAWLETALLSAFALVGHKIGQKGPSGTVFAIVGRLSLIALFIVIMVSIYDSVKEIKVNNENGIGYKNWRQISFRSEFHHWHKVAFPWLDSGMMMATMIMRPLGPYYACTETEALDGISYSIQNNVPARCLAYETRGDLIREGFNTLASYATYILAIISSLQLAHYLHWRREQRELPTPAPTTP